MNKPIKTIAVALAAIAAMSVQQTEACTRATYIGPDNTVITGRTMDWKEDLMSNIYVFPRGMQRAGYNKGNTVNWTSKYGSVIAAGYDIGTCDGMNEKGLVASLLFLPESVYHRPGDNRPIMGISIWTQYVLDNFATVREAVDELKKESFRIDAPDLPNGAASTLHLAITDETGNTAVLEYIDGNLEIHEGKQYQVMTNSPKYERLLERGRRTEYVTGNQPLQRPLCTRIILHQCHSANSRCKDCRTQCIERNAQCFCTVRYHHTGQASYLLHPLAFCIRPEKQSILF